MNPKLTARAFAAATAAWALCFPAHIRITRGVPRDAENWIAYIVIHVLAIAAVPTSVAMWKSGDRPGR